jgi:hypothetical protein
MAKDGVFKGDRAELGGRLEERRRSGLTALQRRYVDIKPEPAVRRREVMPVHPNNITINPLGKAPDAGVGRSGPRGGRPRLIEGEPWVAAGVSRRTWERRKKGGGV